MNLRTTLMSHERPSASSGNEWDMISPESMTISQQVAGATNGIVTIPNIVSLTGAAMTVTGLRQYARGHHLEGTALVAFGRSADLLDGILAKKMRVRGTTGAFLDATLDKGVGVAALGTLTYTGDMKPATTVSIAATQLAIVYENARIQEMGGKATPNLKGKLATFALWAAGGAYMTARTATTMGHERFGSRLRATGNSAAIGAISLGLSAWSDYHKAAATLARATQPTVSPTLCT